MHVGRGAMGATAPTETFGLKPHGVYTFIL